MNERRDSLIIMMILPSCELIKDDVILKNDIIISTSLTMHSVFNNIMLRKALSLTYIFLKSVYEKNIYLPSFIFLIIIKRRTRRGGEFLF